MPPGAHAQLAGYKLPGDFAVLTPSQIADRLRREGWVVTCTPCKASSHVDLGRAERAGYLRCPACGDGRHFDAAALESLAWQLVGRIPDAVPDGT